MGPRLRFIDKGIDRFGYWVGAFSILTGFFSWAGSQLVWLKGFGWPEYLFTGLLAASLILLVVAAGLLAWRQFRPLPFGDGQALAKPPPVIAWSFDNPAFPHMGFLGLGGSGKGSAAKIDVICFQADGTNLSGKPMLRISSYVRSNITNVTYPVYLVVEGTRYAPEDTHGIPANADFHIASAPFIVDGRSPSPDEFRSRFGEMTFVFEYDGNAYSRAFTLGEVNKNLDWFHAVIDPERFPIPRVVPRDGAAPGPANPTTALRFEFPKPQDTEAEKQQ